MFAIFLIALLCTSSIPVGGKWKLNTNESFIIFIAKNLTMSVSGKISGMKVKADYNSTNIFSSSFEGSVDVVTIETKLGLRDNHLRSEDYFDAKKYPKISFKSKSINEEGSVLGVVGDLTIKDVTKEVKILFTVEKNANYHKFVGDITIQRKDFHLGSNSTMIMADVIKIRIFATFMED